MAAWSQATGHCKASLKILAVQSNEGQARVLARHFLWHWARSSELHEVASFS